MRARPEKAQRSNPQDCFYVPPREWGGRLRQPPWSSQSVLGFQGGSGLLDSGLSR